MVTAKTRREAPGAPGATAEATPESLCVDAMLLKTPHNYSTAVEERGVSTAVKEVEGIKQERRIIHDIGKAAAQPKPMFFNEWYGTPGFRCAP